MACCGRCRAAVFLLLRMTVCAASNQHWGRVPVQLQGSPQPAGKPFPPTARMYPAQQKAMTEMRREAVRASAAATTRLLELLDAPNFRSFLRACCDHVGDWPAEELLSTLRANLYSSELIHNFEYDEPQEREQPSSPYMLPSLWQLFYLGYDGSNMTKHGNPSSPLDSSEEGVYHLARFSGQSDVPGTYEEASSRLLYVALNMLRADVGNPHFGNVTAVMSNAYWEGAVATCPIDTGIWTGTCNKTYLDLPGSFRFPLKLPVDCTHDTTVGVYGAMDHALLNSQLFWKEHNVLGHMFARWYGANETWSNVSDLRVITYLEANILANVFSNGIKLLVGNFGALFGTVKGRLLQQLAMENRIALSWALGSGHSATGWPPQDQPPLSLRYRLLDFHVISATSLNVSASQGQQDAFNTFWDEVSAARDSNGWLPSGRIVDFWHRMKAKLTGARLGFPEPNACSDWARCVGIQLDGNACACYPSVLWM